MDAHQSLWGSSIVFQDWEGERIVRDENTHVSQASARRYITNTCSQLKKRGNAAYYCKGLVIPPKGKGKSYEVLNRTDNRYDKRNPDHPRNRNKK